GLVARWRCCKHFSNRGNLIRASWHSAGKPGWSSRSCAVRRKPGNGPLVTLDAIDHLFLRAGSPGALGGSTNQGNRSTAVLHLGPPFCPGAWGTDSGSNSREAKSLPSVRSTALTRDVRGQSARQRSSSIAPPGAWIL